MAILGFLTAVNSCQNTSLMLVLLYVDVLILTSFMQNFEFLALKMTELWLFYGYFSILTAVKNCQQLSKYFPDARLTSC
jgi:hypothetical protein